MKISIKNTVIINKIVETLQLIKNYRKKLNDFKNSINGNSEKDSIAAIRTDLLFHFTSLKNAKNILDDTKIKIGHNDYISFSELSLFELGTLAKKGEIGFGFSKDKIVSKYPVISPILLNAEAEKIINNKFEKRLVVEKSSTGQDSINFSVFDEVRSLSNVDIADCIFFLRSNEGILNNTITSTLEQHGVIRFPYSPRWINYFLEEQKWIFKTEYDYIEFGDDRTSSDPGMRSITLDKLITKIEAYK